MDTEPVGSKPFWPSLVRNKLSCSKSETRSCPLISWKSYNTQKSCRRLYNTVNTLAICHLFTLPSLRETICIQTRIQSRIRNGLGNRIRIPNKSLRVHNIGKSSTLTGQSLDSDHVSEAFVSLPHFLCIPSSDHEKHLSDRGQVSTCRRIRYLSANSLHVGEFVTCRRIRHLSANSSPVGEFVTCRPNSSPVDEFVTCRRIRHLSAEFVTCQ